MIDKYKCSECKDGYQVFIKSDYVFPLLESNYTIHDAEYFECELCHKRSLGAKLVEKRNEIEFIEAKKILNLIIKNGFAHIKEISYLQIISGTKDVDLFRKLKIPKSTISNWCKRNTVLPYYLSIFLAGIFANKLKMDDLELIVKDNINSILIS